MNNNTLNDTFVSPLLGRGVGGEDLKRGVLLLALGSPMYGRLAANLAASIRSADKETPIHLVWQGKALNHLDARQRALFSTLQECKPEYYTKNGREVFFKAKTHLYDLSPFEETIFFDVDLLLFDRRPVSDLFEELKEVDFTMQNRGYCDLSGEVLDENYNYWANVREVKEHYQTTGRYYQLSSELMYFKRTAANEKYFALVKEIFERPKIKAAFFAGDIPDEFAFDIAGAVLHHYPHRDNYVLIYWWMAEKSMPMNEILKHYQGYSLGGHNFPQQVGQRYENMGRYYARKTGVTFQKVFAKRSWSATRKRI